MAEIGSGGLRAKNTMEGSEASKLGEAVRSTACKTGSARTVLFDLRRIARARRDGEPVDPFEASVPKLGHDLVTPLALSRPRGCSVRGVSNEQTPRSDRSASDAGARHGVGGTVLGAAGRRPRVFGVRASDGRAAGPLAARAASLSRRPRLRARRRHASDAPRGPGPERAGRRSVSRASACGARSARRRHGRLRPSAPTAGRRLTEPPQASPAPRFAGRPGSARTRRIALHRPDEHGDEHADERH